MKEKKYKKPFKRKIHLLGKEWSYRVTDKAILVLDPKGQKIWKREIHANGDNGNVSRYCEFGCCHEGYALAITPSRVKKFIERVCLPEVAK